MKESDLYLPLKSFLQSLGYEVKGEVCDCDVVAQKDDITIIVELKLSLNLEVILQAVDRLALSDTVYIGIPKECKSFKKKRKQLLKLIKMLGFGLITIDVNKSKVEVVNEPSEYKPRKSKTKNKRLLSEFEKREGDPNLGGMTTKKGVLTAYRQKALKIAKYLEENGATKASIVSKELEEEKARDIMYKNFYGWFEKTSVGVYDITDKGKEEISTWVKKSSE